MAIKNFVFRENWVGSEVAGMKLAFLSFLTQIWNSLNRMLIFNQLERQKLYYYKLCDFKSDYCP